MAKYRSLIILTATALALGTSVTPAQAQDVNSEWVDAIFGTVSVQETNETQTWVEEIAPFPENSETTNSEWVPSNAETDDSTDTNWVNENLNQHEPEIVLTEEWVDDLYPEGTGDINWIRDNVIGETGQITEEWVEPGEEAPDANGSSSDAAAIAALGAAGLLGAGALAAAGAQGSSAAPAAPSAPAATATQDHAPAATAASNGAARTQLANTGLESGTLAVLALGAMLSIVGALLIAARRRA